MADYHRYHIETKKAPHIRPHPHNFNVRMNRFKLAKFLLKELVQYRGNLKVVLSRPCVYGVFSGPLGGFAPRERLCVGCLRCTTQYPDMVAILRNADKEKLGDSYFLPYYVDVVSYEAQSGRILIRGQGYRGKFGGVGWDSIWTDMSEIVRPTRDGIHGREYISTEVNIGAEKSYIELDSHQQPKNPFSKTLSFPIPFIFDAPPVEIISQMFGRILAETADQLKSLVVLPLESIIQHDLQGSHLVPLVSSHNYPQLSKIRDAFSIIEMQEWDDDLFKKIGCEFPDKIIVLRTDFESDLLAYFKAGVRIFHLTTNYHGKGKSGRFISNLIREAHQIFVQDGVREEVTLIGSGGIVAAEHVPKAIICGLDVVALDTPVFVALQAQFSGPCEERTTSHFVLPANMNLAWGKQRLKNLAAAWRDQLLEILGAMGIREVRRLRGELGRALFQKDLENDAFSCIEGYEIQ